MIPCKPPTMSSSSDADREGHLPKPVGRAGPEVAEHDVIDLSSPKEAERRVIDRFSDSEPEEKQSIPKDSSSEQNEISEESRGSSKDSSSEYDEISEENRGSAKDSSSEHDEIISEENRGSAKDSSSEYDEISEENRGSAKDSSFEHDQTSEENPSGPEDGENDQIKINFQLADDASPRTRVIYMLQQFESKRKDFLSKEEERVKAAGSGMKRPDLKAFQSLMDNRDRVNGDKPLYGEVEGVEVGDRYSFRVELLLICLHRQTQGGSDYMRVTEGKYKGSIVAVSVVISGGYKENDDRGDTIIYTGSGKGKQKLEKGNLGLFNSYDQGRLVRVIRGERTKQSPKSGMRYYYDGLYHVVDCYPEKSSDDLSMKWKYKLVRKAGQRPRGERIIHEDLSAGIHEPSKVRVVGRLDDDRVPSYFEYISSVRYSPGIRPPLPATPCVCSQKCSQRRQEACACITLNGGIRYNDNRILLRAERLIYECGPMCSCLRAKKCTNRVTQMGLRFDMEVFQTLTKEWGVRSSNSILQGRFVCEYLGQIMRDTDAANLNCKDYLFDLMVPQSIEDVEDDENSPKYTVDANLCGNLSRFIKHSFEPNLLVQCVFYEHHDHHFPHVMLFASKDIAPYDELTYDHGDRLEHLDRL